MKKNVTKKGKKGFQTTGWFYDKSGNIHSIVLHENSTTIQTGKIGRGVGFSGYKNMNK